MHTRKEQMEAFGRFLDILDELREKCPWDRKQTNESLRPNTIEETYELCDARIASDRLDKTYFDKFKKILPCKKIYLVQRAEMRFHRELLKGMHKKGDASPRKTQGKR